MITVYFKSYATNPPSASNLVPWVSKDGAAFAMRSERPTSIGSGWYKLTLSVFWTSWEVVIIRIHEGAMGGVSESIPDIVVEAEKTVDISGLENVANKILGLAGHFTITNDTLTAYNDNGTTNAVYDLTRNLDGEITAIEPHTSN